MAADATLASVTSRRAKRAQDHYCVAVADLPQYPAELEAMVERVIADLPRHQLWFTYRDIRRYFGVSRATVARRLRERLVPGVRMDGEHVVEEASVRRFDRTQLKWILLAARHRGRHISLRVS